MLITESKLREIILEEYRKLNEAGGRDEAGATLSPRQLQKLNTSIGMSIGQELIDLRRKVKYLETSDEKSIFIFTVKRLKQGKYNDMGKLKSINLSYQHPTIEHYKNLVSDENIATSLYPSGNDYKDDNNAIARQRALDILEKMQ